MRTSGAKTPDGDLFHVRYLLRLCIHVTTRRSIANHWDFGNAQSALPRGRHLRRGGAVLPLRPGRLPLGNFPYTSCTFSPCNMGCIYAPGLPGQGAVASHACFFTASRGASWGTRSSADGSRTTPSRWSSRRGRRRGRPRSAARSRRGHTWPRAVAALPSGRPGRPLPRRRPRSFVTPARARHLARARRAHRPRATACRSTTSASGRRRAADAPRRRLHERHQRRPPPDRHRRGARARPRRRARRRSTALARVARHARPPRDARRLLLQLLRHHLARAHAATSSRSSTRRG